MKNKLIMKTLDLIPFDTFVTVINRLVKEEKAMLIDVRRDQEFCCSAVKNSINIPLDELSSSLDLIPKDRPLILYCQSGARSEQAALLLSDLGYDQVYNAMRWNAVRDALEQ